VVPGEGITVDLALKNAWADASDVTVTLVDIDPYLVVYNNNLYLGNMAMNEERNCSFSLGIRADCPYGYDIPLNICITDSSGTEKNFLINLPISFRYHDGWPLIKSDNRYISHPVVCDIDGDGRAELFVSSYDADGGKIYGFNHDGSLLPGSWPICVEPGPGPPSLGDIDNDGELELVVVTGCGDYIDAWNLDGTPVTTGNWPYFIGLGKYGYRWRFTPNLFTPVLADLDNNGSLEVIIGGLVADTWTEGKIYVFNGDGTLYS
ncbi:unnamed protein product, partial [marine sediment metagenome]